MKTSFDSAMNNFSLTCIPSLRHEQLGSVKMLYLMPHNKEPMSSANTQPVQPPQRRPLTMEEVQAITKVVDFKRDPPRDAKQREAETMCYAMKHFDSFMNLELFSRSAPGSKLLFMQLRAVLPFFSNREHSTDDGVPRAVSIPRFAHQLLHLPPNNAFEDQSRKRPAGCVQLHAHTTLSAFSDVPNVAGSQSRRRFLYGRAEERYPAKDCRAWLHLERVRQSVWLCPVYSGECGWTRRRCFQCRTRRTLTQRRSRTAFVRPSLYFSCSAPARRPLY